MKNKSNNDSPTSTIYEGNFVADPLSIANVFNDFFSTVAQKVQSKIKFSSKSFSDFLPSSICESIMLSLITENEISKIISSLNSSKSTFNLSSTTGIFANSLKSAKVIPILKKTQNWLCLIRDQYLLFPTWTKLLGN